MKRVITIILFHLYLFTNFSLHGQIFEKRFIRDQSGYVGYSSACAKRSNGNNLISIGANYDQGSGGLAEIDSKGDTVWFKQYKNSSTSYGNIKINFIEELSDKRIFLAGALHNSSGYYTSFFAIADSLGNMQNFKRYMGRTSLNMGVSDIAIDTDGSVYFVGSYSDLYSGGVTFYSWNVPLICKLKPDLTVDWVRTVGSTTHTNSDRNSGHASGIKIAPDGTVIACGYAEQDGTSTPIISGYNFLIKINKYGTFLWDKKLDRKDDYGIGLEVLSNGDIFTFSNIAPTSTVYGGYDLLVKKFDLNGNILWAKTVGSSYSDFFYKVRYEPISNNFLLSGLRSNSTNSDAWFLKIDTAANFLVSRLWGKNNSLNENLRDAIRIKGNRYLLVGENYLGAHVIQTDLNGMTTCSDDTSSYNKTNYAVTVSSGVSNSGETITGTALTTSKLNFPLSFNMICYSCPSSSSTISESACGTYTAPDGAVYTTSGAKTAILTNAAGCDSTITINLTINNATSSTITQTACGSYTAPDGVVYTTSGTKTAIIPNAAGCDSTITINLTIKNATSSTISQSACGSYTAPDGAVYTTSGTKTAVITNAAGCDSTITINLTINTSPPQPNITQNGNTLTCTTNGMSYQWYLNGAIIVGATNQTYEIIESGNYIVEVTDVNTCSNTSNTFNAIYLGINEIEENNFISVYPNPTTGKIQVQSLKYKVYKILVYNLLGEIVYLSLVTDHSLLEVDLSNQSNGIYFLNCITEKGEQKIKIVKQ